ncbi:MAG: DUF2764 family protein [Treponema sp.]|nr:DUF2764 family protein [Treponema sp.]
MAQLPCLIHEQKKPMSSADFKELARSQMSKKDASFLDQLSLNETSFKKTGCSFIDKWNNWENSLRLSLAKQRAVKLKRENDQPSGAPVFMDAAAAASKAIDETSPLDGEEVIDKARWYAIDSFTWNDFFNRNNVYAYYLKLLLLERCEAFNAEKGFAEYKSLYASIVESAQNTLGEST